MGKGFEYGVEYWREPGELHRGPMTETEARQWVAEFETDGGRVGAFLVVRREVGEWQAVESEPGYLCDCGTWVPRHQSATHCFFHHVNEVVGPDSIVCGECFHAYMDEAQMKQIEMERWPDSDPDRQVLSCPYCIHDL